MTHKAAPRKLLTRLLAVGISTTLLWACNGGGDASPTTTPSTPAPSIAAPTTVATTTTTPPTTAPPTTAATTTTSATTAAPVTTIGGSPEEVARAEVLQTLDAFWTAVDACNAAPSECETTRVIDTYTVPTTTIATWLVDRIDRLVASNERSTELERNERRIANFQFDGSSRAAATQCMTDRSVRVRDVEGSTEVVDDGVGFFRIDFILERTGDRWIIADSIISRVEQSGSGICAT